MAKRDTQRRINTRPDGVASATGTLVTSSLVSGGVPNVIGGWIFGPASLSNSDIVLHSGGWIQVGDDDQVVRLDSQDTGYRMWAGAPLGADAPFSITVDGSLHAENAYIEGEIVAATGTIGGFEIGADYIRDVADSMGLASTVTGGDDVRFWAGDTFANRATADFRVTEAGALTATSATITGAITATSGDLGTLSVSGVLTLAASAAIKSTNYSGGLAGWQIDYSGDAEFANIYARGRIDTAVFQYDQISAIAGSLLVTPEAGVLASAYTTAGTLTIEDAGFAFTDGSVVRIRAKDSLGAVQQVWVTVTRTGTDNVYTTALESGDNKTWPVGTAVLGYGTGGGSLMMTAASALDGPRYSVLTHSTDPWTDETEIGRFGFLDDWQTYAGVDYGIAIGDYAGGNYLLYGTTTGLEIGSGSGEMMIDGDGLTIAIQTSVSTESTLKWMSGATQRVSVWAHSGPAGGEANIGITAENGANSNAVYLQAVGGSSVNAVVVAEALAGGAGSQVGIYAESVVIADVAGETWVRGPLQVDGDLAVYRNATTYTGYIFVPLATPATSTAWDGDLYDVDNDEIIIDLSVAFGIPAGVKAVLVNLGGSCPTAGKIQYLGPNATYYYALAGRSQVAGVYNSDNGIVPCDANGDIFFSTDAVHGAEFATTIRIWGYWI